MPENNAAGKVPKRSRGKLSPMMSSVISSRSYLVENQLLALVSTQCVNVVSEFSSSSVCEEKASINSRCLATKTFTWSLLVTTLITSCPTHCETRAERSP